MLLDVVDQIGRLRHSDAVIEAMSRTAARLGYTAFAIGAPSRGDVFNGYFFSTWPQSWIDVYTRELALRDDPVPQAAALNVMPFLFTDMVAGRAGMTMSPNQLRAYELASAHGYREGVVVPVHGPGAYLVVASYAGNDPDTTPAAITMLHVMTLHAHVRLASLHTAEHSASPPAPGTSALSAREVEALQGVLSGLSDATSALRMGVSERTVRFHLGNARRKLGARTRAQAVSAALSLGHLYG